MDIEFARASDDPPANEVVRSRSPQERLALTPRFVVESVLLR